VPKLGNTHTVGVGAHQRLHEHGGSFFASWVSGIGGAPIELVGRVVSAVSQPVGAGSCRVLGAALPTLSRTPPTRKVMQLDGPLRPGPRITRLPP
jgi:hypothetical protein